MFISVAVGFVCQYWLSNQLVLPTVDSTPVWARGVCVCPRIDPLPLAGCHRRRLNQGLVVALGFSHRWIGHVFVLFFSVYGCMLCLVRYLFVISASVIDCLGRFVPKMTYYVSSGLLNLTKLNPVDNIWAIATLWWIKVRLSELFWELFGQWKVALLSGWSSCWIPLFACVHLFDVEFL